MKYKFIPVHLWLAVFVIGAGFQWWRGSKGDFVIFGLIALLLILSLIRESEITYLGNPRFVIAAWWLALSTSILMISQIHSVASTVSLLLLLPLLLSIIWRKEVSKHSPPTERRRITSRLWISLALLLSLSEMGNFFGSYNTGNDLQYPTLTVLVDPVIYSTAGRIVFVFLWSLIGVELLKGSTER
ncbi:MAG: hypothetical protein HY050_08575 [Actinobacteria bacterium]|nr:hypothetical protein [Actinomycetota bacterium]